MKYNIGIGITEHNRPDVFGHTLMEIKRFMPSNAKLIIVDDASDIPVIDATFRFEVNVGIARAKNKCLELLEDCDHIFLFDSDTYPISANWWVPYCENPEPHLMYIFQDFPTGHKLRDTEILYRDSKIVAYSHPRGCMLYYKRECLERIGGMVADFGRWGYEHGQLSDRIHNAGLTLFRYADVPGSDKLFYSGDEHRSVTSTVNGLERRKWITRNQKIYEQLKGSADYVSYK